MNNTILPEVADTFPTMDESRSLWKTAFLRLRRNKAAMTSLFVLMIYILVAIFGPALYPHHYSNIYRDFTRLGPSLEAHPNDIEVISFAEKALARGGAQIADHTLDGETLSLTLTSEKEIDPRITRYLDRSDNFGTTRVVEESSDKKTLVLESSVERKYFLLGTDSNGRDLLARILIGIRISLIVAALATGVGLTIGVFYGAIAGFFGGRVDNLMMRFVDIMYALPFMFFVILLVVFLGQNIFLIFIAIGFVEWLDMARIVRGQAITLKRREFVQAAEALGVSSRGIIRRHIIPNALGPVVIYMTLMIPRVILTESFLSFLGLGVQEPLTSLGVLISEGAKNFQVAFYMLLSPALALIILLVSFNFLGDGLRDALDPKDR